MTKEVRNVEIEEMAQEILKNRVRRGVPQSPSVSPQDDASFHAMNNIKKSICGSSAFEDYEQKCKKKDKVRQKLFCSVYFASIFGETPAPPTQGIQKRFTMNNPGIPDYGQFYVILSFPTDFLFG